MATRSGQVRARKQPAEVRREELLDAATHVFADTPYRAAGTAEIARQAGVAEPTLYRHFGSKRELYLEALERTATMIIDAWRHLTGNTVGSRETLTAIGDWYVRKMIENADLLRLRHRAAAEADADDVREVLRRGYDEVVQMIAAVIRGGQERGEISREVEPEAAAWLFVGIGQVIDLSVMMGADPQSGNWCHDIGAVFNRALQH
jgi:AcrR family transcriptional regulator